MYIGSVKLGRWRYIQLNLHTPEPNLFEVETAIAKLKRNKLPGTDQIRAKLIQAGN
jgi:hypothetical protein